MKPVQISASRSSTAARESMSAPVPSSATLRALGFSAASALEEKLGCAEGERGPQVHLCEAPGRKRKWSVLPLPPILPPPPPYPHLPPPRRDEGSQIGLQVCVTIHK